MKRIIRVSVILAIVVAVIAAIAWKLGENKKKIDQQAELTQQTSGAVLVTTAAATRETMKGDFDVNGSFQPYKQVALMSDVQGKITSLSIDNGDFVSEGKIVLTVDNDLIQNQLDVAQLNLKKAEKDVSRMTNLLGEGGVTQQQLDDAKLAVENLKAQITGLNKQKSYTYIKAPIAGTISGKSVEKGSFLAPGMKIADIVNVRKLKMSVYVTEDQVFSIKEGQKIRLSADLYPEKSYYGNVTYIDVKADPSKRYLVEVELDNSSNTLKAGMDGKAYFSSGKSVNTLALPRECLVGSVREAKVYVVEGNKARLKSITAGAIFGDKVQVVDGLREGTLVVRTGQINLQDGADVKVSQ